LSIKDTFLGTTSSGHGDVVVRIGELAAGYASPATRKADRSELSLWLAHCQQHGHDLFAVRRADIEAYGRVVAAAGGLLTDR
jgi:hypothetical protein